jgi:hypothetical protein
MKGKYKTLKVVLTSSRESNYNNNASNSGYILSLTFHTPTGNHIQPAEVSRRAAEAVISPRTGYMCNPGGAIGLLGLRLWDTVVDYWLCGYRAILRRGCGCYQTNFGIGHQLSGSLGGGEICQEIRTVKIAFIYSPYLNIFQSILDYLKL